MLQWEKGRVLEELPGWDGVQRLRVQLTAPGAVETIRALSYLQILGRIAPGEHVLLNTNALRRGLGTGGDALVVARLDLPAEPAEQPAGHLVKARYTPQQLIVDAIDDPASPHYATLSAAQSLDGMPVVVADLHSALPAVIAGIRADAPDARVAYVMSDGAALPAAYSRTVATVREAGWIAACISSGQSFGGDLEAVTVHSALLGARHVVGADIAILIQGPGNLGTGTGWGFSGMQAAEGMHAAHVLGGAPIAALRVSGADARERHRGLSHHTATVCGQALLAPVLLPLPRADSAQAAQKMGGGEDNDIWLSVTEQLYSAVVKPARSRGVHHLVEEVELTGLRDALALSPVALSTMGRGIEEDAPAFLAAAAAGRCAASLLRSRSDPGPRPAR